MARRIRDAGRDEYNRRRPKVRGYKTGYVIGVGLLIAGIVTIHLSRISTEAAKDYIKMGKDTHDEIEELAHGKATNLKCARPTTMSGAKHVRVVTKPSENPATHYSWRAY